jgi:hypothetical protein
MLLCFVGLLVFNRNLTQSQLVKLASRAEWESV